MNYITKTRNQQNKEGVNFISFLIRLKVKSITKNSIFVVIILLYNNVINIYFLELLNSYHILILLMSIYNKMCLGKK